MNVLRKSYCQNKVKVQDYKISCFSINASQRSNSYSSVTILANSAATRKLFLGGQNLILGGGGQNFWFGLFFSEFSVDLKKKKWSSCQFGLLFSEFSVDFKKKVISPQMVLLIS